jgi:hypothetical protein
MSTHPVRLAGAATFAVLMALLSAGIAVAHVTKQAGPYTIEIGWQNEPTYVGETNGVQIIVHDADDQPVTDLTEDDLKVVVSNGSEQTGELTFEPGFDVEEGWGQPAEYNASIMPTAPGEYTFHLTGAIHGEPVDIVVTSGDETFDSVKGTSEIQFPAKLPTLAEVVTRLDQIDERLASGEGPTQEDLDAALTSAKDAQGAADRALLVGGGLGLAGLAVGIWSLATARRAPRGT